MSHKFAVKRKRCIGSSIKARTCCKLYLHAVLMITRKQRRHMASEAACNCHLPMLHLRSSWLCSSSSRTAKHLDLLMHAPSQPLLAHLPSSDIAQCCMKATAL